jgi:hypothetical protein
MRYTWRFLATDIRDGFLISALFTILRRPLALLKLNKIRFSKPLEVFVDRPLEFAKNERVNQ